MSVDVAGCKLKYIDCRSKMTISSTSVLEYVTYTSNLDGNSACRGNMRVVANFNSKDNL